jgi:glycosyltransferase involved in cell wall biosynthesis
MTKIAILIPCYNEELTIKKVVTDFQKELPNAEIYVYNNNSQDKTLAIAKKLGVHVCNEYNQGKGNVIRRMFREINAEVYVMVDADDTYPANMVHELIKPVIDGTADMVVGDRLSNGTYKSHNKRKFHNFGNKLVKCTINSIFHTELNDIMSGYRAFNNVFVKIFPVLSSGFEVETEMTMHALDKRFIIKEIPIDYQDRPKGSSSKLNTFKDGMKVIKTIIKMNKDYKPYSFFTKVALIIFLCGIIVGIPVLYEYINYRYVYKVPSAVLAMGLIILSLIVFQCGVILDTIVKQHKEDFEYRLIDYEKDNKKNK